MYATKWYATLVVRYDKRLFCDSYSVGKGEVKSSILFGSTSKIKHLAEFLLASVARFSSLLLCKNWFLCWIMQSNHIFCVLNRAARLAKLSANTNITHI